MKPVLLLFTFSFLSYLSFGQPTSLKQTVVVHGLVKERNTMTPVPNADLAILRDSDTLKRVKSDHDGNYSLQLDVKEGDRIEIYGKAKHHEVSKNLIVIESVNTEDYLLNVELVYQTVNHAPPRVFFEKGKVQHVPFDLTMYKELLEDNPKVCLEIELMSHPSENEKLTKKRLIRFEKFLIQSKFPMNQVDFNFTHKELTCTSEDTCKSELLFEISSVEGHCLQE